MKDMKTETKTYVVKGYMEWHLRLPTGFDAKPYIHIAFTGGQITGYGIAPARYSTSDPFLQNLIENCDRYKTGFIRLLRQR